MLSARAIRARAVAERPLTVAVAARYSPAEDNGSVGL